MPASASKSMGKVTAIAKKIKKSSPKAVKIKTMGLKSQMKQIGKKVL